MRILSIDQIPLHQIPYRYVRPGGSESVGNLAIHIALVDRLPASMGAIVVTSDLQAREFSGDLLLAEVLAHDLCELAELEAIPSTSRIGVVLAGDLLARQSLDKVSGTGDVRDVWHKFARSFRWVTGVPGNHDSLGETHEQKEAFKKTRGVHFLDGDAVELDNIQFAGIGGIIGKPSKPQRRDETHFIRCLRGVLKSQPGHLRATSGSRYSGSRSGWNTRDSQRTARPQR